MKETVILACIVLSLYLLANIPFFETENMVQSVSGTYMVYGTSYAHAKMSIATTTDTLRITQSLLWRDVRSQGRPIINVKSDLFNRDYYYMSKNENYYSFTPYDPMVCPIGENKILIGKNNDSIKVQFCNSSNQIFLSGIKVSE